MITEIVTNFIELSVLAGSVLLFAIILYFLYSKSSGKRIGFVEDISVFARKNYLLLGFLISLGAVLGSLFYSEILRLEPCTLCWYQRGFIISQAFIFGIALALKEKKAVIYSLTLSVAGALIAGYHLMLQAGVVSEDGILCSAADAVDCAQASFVSYGFISIPVMSLVAFLFLIVLGLNFRSK
jgi:disulfide bond formation protein DsbB